MRTPALIACGALIVLVTTLWLVLQPRERDRSHAAAPGTAVVGTEVERDAAASGRDLASPLASGAAEVRAEATPTSVPSASEPAAADAVPYLVSGRVVGAAGNAIAAATVYAMTESGWIGPALDSRSYEEGGRERLETRTDDAGRFELSGLGPGTARIAVRAAGWAPYDNDRVALLPGERHELEAIVLAPGVRLAGRVVDPRGGVAGAELVRVDDAQDLFFGAIGSARGALLATTGADGSFLVDAVAPGPWKLMVLSPEHPDQVFEGSGEEGGRELRGLVFELRAGSAIEGRVAGRDDLAGLVVRATPPGDTRVRSLSGPLPWREAACDADGVFRVGGLDDHPSYALRVREPGGRLWDMHWLCEPIEAAPGARDVRIELTPAAALAFRVADSSGAPVEGWSVRLEHRGKGEHSAEELGKDDERLTRAPDGSAVLTGLQNVPPDRETTVTVMHASYFPVTSAAVRIVPGVTVDAGLLELVPRPLMTVRVIEAGSGRALAGVEVALKVANEPPEVASEIEISYSAIEDGEHHTATTDAEGLARLPRIESRAGELTAHDAEHAPSAPLAVRLAPGEKEGLEPAFVIVLSQGAAVDVHVLDPLGAPASGTSVVVTELSEAEPSSRAETTDAEGRIVFDHLRTGRFRIEAQRIGSQGFVRFVTSSTPEPLSESTVEIDLADGERREVQLVRPARGRLTGRIREAGAPLAGATLSIEDPSEGFSFGGEPMARSDAEGHYAIEPLDAGSYTLVISHATRAMDERIEVEIVEGDNVVDCELSLTVIEGHVFDPRGRPLQGARVEVTNAEHDSRQGGGLVFSLGGSDGLTLELGGNNSDRAVRSGPDGSYRLRGVRPGVELHLVASHADHRSVRQGPLRLTPDELRVADLRLLPAGKLEVNVRTAAGQPAEGIQLEATFDEKTDEPIEAVHEQTDRAGRALLFGLAPGRWRVHATNGEGESHTVVIAADETARLALVLR